jgi:REP element-mobilizing transposase RayT
MTIPDPNSPKRKIHHLKDFDYSQNGAYYITIVTYNRSCLFGSIIDDEMMVNDAGEMVSQVLEAMPDVIPDLAISPHQIMPNHIHAILIIEHSVGSGFRARPEESEEPNTSLFDIVARFKSLTTNRYIYGVKNLGWPVFEQRLWQRSFYEHVIRNEREHQAISDYILSNPMNWEKDKDFRM